MALNWSYEFSAATVLSYTAQLALGWDNQNRLWMWLLSNVADNYIQLTYGLDEYDAGAIVTLPAFTQSFPALYAAISVDPVTASDYWAVTTDSHSGLGVL